MTTLDPVENIRIQRERVEDAANELRYAVTRSTPNDWDAQVVAQAAILQAEASMLVAVTITWAGGYVAEAYRSNRRR